MVYGIVLPTLLAKNHWLWPYFRTPIMIEVPYLVGFDGENNGEYWFIMAKNGG